MGQGPITVSYFAKQNNGYYVRAGAGGPALTNPLRKRFSLTGKGLWPLPNG